MKNYHSLMFLKNQTYDLIFLDHDLGGKVYEEINGYNTGSLLARIISEEKIYLHNAKIIVHSLNPDGSKYMVSKIKDSFAIPFIWKKDVFQSKLIL